MPIHKWQFKGKPRARAYGWRGSKLAIARLKEAVSEIRSVAKTELIAAGDGAVSLMERLWPAFQGIDTSSGALGTAVHRTLEEIIPMALPIHAVHRIVAGPDIEIARSALALGLSLDDSCFSSSIEQSASTAWKRNWPPSLPPTGISTDCGPSTVE